jgi:hypothetical protein
MRIRTSKLQSWKLRRAGNGSCSRSVGEWCTWCHILDKYFRDNPTLAATDGKLLHSQATYLLEQGESYNLAKFTAFLQKWAPPNRP